VAGVTALALVVALRQPTPTRLVSLARPDAPVLARAVANGQLRLGLHAAPVPASAVPASTVPVRTVPDLARTVPGEAVPAPPVSLVVGFDNSEPARRALSWAVRQAAAHPAVLRIIYADHVVVNSDLSGFAHAEMVTAQDQEAAEVAGAAAEIAAGSGVPYMFERRPGAPADAISSGASAQAAAGDGEPVIVVGRSGHAARHVLGSVPVRLLHHSSYPVLAIP
jgi:nucleotide-binding universal stress UspA family protein